MMSKIMSQGLDGTLKHEELFGNSRWIIYQGKLVGVGVFSFLLSLFVYLYSNAIEDFEINLNILDWFLNTNFKYVILSDYISVFDITYVWLYLWYSND